MSSADDSPSSWEHTFSSIQELSVTPRKSDGVPGGVEDLSAPTSFEQPPPSVRESVVVDDVSVVYVRSGPGQDVCGGRIGSSKARFCMSPCEEGTTGCRFASHLVKADIRFPGYYIQAIKGTTAFCEPCVLEPSEGFSGVILNAFQGKRSTAEWTRLFSIISTAAELDDHQQSELLARGERMVAMGPTPMKRKVIVPDQDISADSSNIEGDHDPDDLSLSSTNRVYAEALVEPGTPFERTMVHIATYWNEVIQAGFEQFTLLKQVEASVQTDMEEIDDKVVQVSSTVGVKPLGSSLPLTVWSAISSVAEDVMASEVHMSARYSELVSSRDELASDVDSVKTALDKHVKPAVQLLSNMIKEIHGQGLPIAPDRSTGTWESGIAKDFIELKRDHLDMTKQLDKLKALVETTVSSQGGRRNLEKEFDGFKKTFSQSVGQGSGLEMAELKYLVQELDKRVHDLEMLSRPPTSQGDSNRLGVNAYEQTLEDLRAQIYSVRRQVDTQGNVPPYSGSHCNDNSVGELIMEMATLRDQMAALELDNVKIRSEIITDTMSFGGHYFMTEESYVEFVLTHFPKGQTHFLLDFISMCECASNRNRSTADGLRNMKMIHGAGFKSSNEGTVFASFGTVIPVLFGEEQDSRDATKKMGSMTTMKEWDPNTNRAGRKNIINTALFNFKRATELQIASVFGQSTVPALFFKNLLQSTWSFWEAFASWVTNFENEMSQQMCAEGSEAQKAQIWNLICWLIHSMFTEMEARRAPGRVAESVDVTDASGNCAAILHGTLCGHKFMTELKDLGFSRHPLFAATMSEFLMTTKASVIILEEVKATAKSALVAVRALQSDKDKKGRKGGLADTA